MPESRIGTAIEASRSAEECEQAIAVLLEENSFITKGAVESLAALSPCHKLKILEMMRDTHEGFSSDRIIH